MPCRRKKYKPVRAQLVSKSLLFAYASRALIDESYGWKVFHRAVLTEHCVMVLMVIVLQFILRTLFLC